VDNFPAYDRLFETCCLWLPRQPSIEDFKLVERGNTIVEKIIEGNTRPDEILDFLNDNDESPDEYMDAVIENLESSPFLYA
jgi:hypothetical protein